MMMVLKCVELFSGFFAYPPFKLGVFVQSINAISIQRKILIMSFMKKKEKYHHWVYAADDQINKVLKTAIVSLYCYGFYVIIKELVEKL
tara:strand:- start:274 stop:540 length:267 start_codon:yes stop_codon:yes gene_type:complete